VAHRGRVTHEVYDGDRAPAREIERERETRELQANRWDRKPPLPSERSDLSRGRDARAKEAGAGEFDVDIGDDGGAVVGWRRTNERREKEKLESLERTAYLVCFLTLPLDRAFGALFPLVRALAPKCSVVSHTPEISLWDIEEEAGPQGHKSTGPQGHGSTGPRVRQSEPQELTEARPRPPKISRTSATLLN